MGQLVSKNQQQRVQSLIERVIKKAATVLCGGKQPSVLKGFFVEPTIFVNVREDMTIWKEEIFGPVLSVRGNVSLSLSLSLSLTLTHSLTHSLSHCFLFRS
jgi:betaine-aldehyde dehydrogenase